MNLPRQTSRTRYSDGWNDEQVPDEITLTAATMAASTADPALMEDMEAAAEGGRAALIEFLDEHGLPWRPGGSSPEQAFADGGFVEWESFAPTPGVDVEASRARRRKAARKAARQARKMLRR